MSVLCCVYHKVDSNVEGAAFVTLCHTRGGSGDDDCPDAPDGYKLWTSQIADDCDGCKDIVSSSDKVSLQPKLD